MAVQGCMMGSFGMMGYGWLFQLLIFVVFFLIVWWVMKSSNVQSGVAETQSPLDILKTRLAKGEITRKEYEQLRKELEE